MPPAARVLDMTAHGLPLNPGPGSPDVIIGFMLAWRAMPAAAAAGLQATQSAGDTSVKAAAATRSGASGTPGFPAALAAETAARAAATTAFVSAANAAASAAAALGGTPDMHVCTIPLVPPTAVHGPGYVLQASTTVKINGLPACRQGDKVVEALGGPDPIHYGMPDGDDRLTLAFRSLVT